MKNVSLILLFIVCIASCYGPADGPDVQDQHIIGIAAAKDITYGLTKGFAHNKYICAITYASSSSANQERLQHLTDMLFVQLKTKGTLGIIDIEEILKEEIGLQNNAKGTYVKVVSLILHTNGFNKPLEYRCASVEKLGGWCFESYNNSMPFQKIVGVYRTNVKVVPVSLALKSALLESSDLNKIAEEILVLENASGSELKDLIFVMDKKRLQERKKSCSIQ